METQLLIQENDIRFATINDPILDLEWFLRCKTIFVVKPESVQNLDLSRTVKLNFEKLEIAR